MSEKKLSSEVLAMASMEEALTPLEEEARVRVLRWACDRYGVQQAASSVPNLAQRHHNTGRLQERSPTGSLQFESIADLYAVAEPTTDADRALVAGYWLQGIQGESELEAASVNKELKNLGHAVANITSAFDTLMARRPQPVVQTRKSGKTRQARKKYKLTEEGKRAVERMLGSCLDE